MLPTGESISLSIKPTHMPVLTSIQLEVNIEKIVARKVYIEFKGAKMHMGQFRSVLKSSRPGTYTTQTILPTCTHEQMLWDAVIHIEGPHRHYSAPFLLITQRPSNKAAS